MTLIQFNFFDKIIFNISLKVCKFGKKLAAVKQLTNPVSESLNLIILSMMFQFNIILDSVIFSLCMIFIWNY